jgi:hypothetical protein
MKTEVLVPVMDPSMATASPVHLQMQVPAAFAIKPERMISQINKKALLFGGLSYLGLGSCYQLSGF